MIRYMGIALLVCMSTGYGWFLSNQLKERYKELLEIKRLFMLLKGEIEYTRTPIGQAFMNIADKSSHDTGIGEFLRGISIELSLYRGKTFYDIWEHHISVFSNTCLKKEDKIRLQQLGTQMGFLDAKMQIDSIQLYLELLEQDLAEAYDEYRINSKLYQKLGFLGGMMLAIILL